MDARAGLTFGIEATPAVLNLIQAASASVELDLDPTFIYAHTGPGLVASQTLEIAPTYEGQYLGRLDDVTAKVSLGVDPNLFFLNAFEFDRSPGGGDGTAGDGTPGHEIELRKYAGELQWRYDGDVAWKTLITLADITGPAGRDGFDVSIEFQATPYYIQWRHQGETAWRNLVALSAITGPAGVKGDPARDVEFRKGTTYLQWRYVGSPTWTDLVLLSDLVGQRGTDGAPGTPGTPGTPGATGPGFTNATVNGSGHLILTKTDSTTIDAGVTRGADGAAGHDGVDGRSVELRRTSTELQWRLAGDTLWNSLVALIDITGPQGTAGTNGTNGAPGAPGADGRQVELRAGTSYIQWRYVGDTVWLNLIALSAITGAPGSNGVNGRDPEFRMDATSGWMQYRLLGDSAWINLVTIASLSGPSGSNGTNGKQIEMQAAGGYVQWRYVGDSTWTNLIALTALQGPKGDTGNTGSTGASGPQWFTIAGGGTSQLGSSWALGDFALDTTNGDIWRKGSNGAAFVCNIKGPQGNQGAPGTAGLSVTAVNVNGSGHLIVTRSDSTTLDAGYVLGPQGNPGTAGADGRSIQSVAVNGSNHLIVTYSDSTTYDAGLISAAGATALANLTDVVVTGASDGQVLAFEQASGKWKPKTVTAGAAALSSLTDVSVTEGAGIAGYTLNWNNSTSKWEATAPVTWANLSGKPTLATVATSGSYTDLSNKPTLVTALTGLTDVNVTEGAAIDGKVLTWNQASSKWIATTPAAAGAAALTGLTDVSVAEGAGIAGYTLNWNNSTSKWEATAPVTWANLSGKPTLATVATSGSYTDLSNKPTLVTALTGLTDVSVAEGAGIAGYTLNWNNSTSKWEATAPVTWANLSGKPTLATVATSGSYTDLSNKPTIVSTLAALTDVSVTEGLGIDGYYLKWDNTAGRWIASAVSAGTGGASAFTDLTDAPHAYSGQAGKVVSVKTDESGVEFTNLPAIAAGVGPISTAYTRRRFATDFAWNGATITASNVITDGFSAFLSGTGSNFYTGSALVAASNGIPSGGAWGAVNTGSTATGSGSIYVVGGFRPAQFEMQMETRVVLPVLSNGTDTYIAKIGFINSTNPTDSSVGSGVYFQYTHGTNGGRWQAIYRNGSTTTILSADTGVAGDINPRKMRVVIAQGGLTAYFYIDDALVATLSCDFSNYLTLLFPVVGLAKTVGTTAVEIYADYIEVLPDTSWWTSSATGTLPGGGNAGQVLKKKSDRAGDVAWANGTTVAGNPWNRRRMFTDLLSNATLSATTAMTDDYFVFTGSGTGWSFAGGSGSGGFPQNILGAAQLSCGTASPGQAYLHAVTSYQPGVTACEFGTYIAIPTLSDATNTFEVNAGFINTGTAQEASIGKGYYFHYEYNVNGGRWRCAARNGSSALTTYVDSGVTVATSTPYRFKIAVNTDNTQADFYINDALVGSITTNLPTGLQGRPLVGLNRSAGTVARQLNVDYIDFIPDTTWWNSANVSASLPPGGALGAVLQKQSSADGDVVWADASSVSADIHNRTAKATLDNADELLIWDSTAAANKKVTKSTLFTDVNYVRRNKNQFPGDSGNGWGIPYTFSNNWSNGNIPQAGDTNGNVFWVEETITVSQLILITEATASGTCYGAIYTWNEATKTPGVILNNGSASGSFTLAINSLLTSNITATLTPGPYFLAMSLATTASLSFKAPIVQDFRNAFMTMTTTGPQRPALWNNTVTRNGLPATWDGSTFAGASSFARGAVSSLNNQMFPFWLRWS